MSVVADPFIFQKLETTRLAQRCRTDASGARRFQLKNGGWVKLSGAEWQELNREFAGAIASSGRALRWSTILQIPFAIAVMAVLVNIPALWDVVKTIDGTPGMLLWLLISCGLPFAMMARHVLTVRRAVAAVDRVLSERPRCDPPLGPPPRALNTLEILALVLVGPHLLIQIYGTFDPDAFRNTPLTGSSLDASGYAGLAVVAGLAFLRWRRLRPSAQTARPATPAPDEPPGRRLDVASRARQSIG